jgi:nicotinamidase-related amidase
MLGVKRTVDGAGARPALLVTTRMTADLATQLAPARTALVTQECQRGVIGDLALLPALADAARPIVPNVARLAASARRVGARVVHCTALRREDGAGSSTNARLFLATRKSGRAIAPDSQAAEVLPEVGVGDADLIVPRFHGVSPMHGTELDALLRNLGVRTLVVVGVSLNVALPSLVIDAVNAGYRVVLPRDAVAGLPAEYVEAVLEHTFAVLATLTTTATVLRCWRSRG